MAGALMVPPPQARADTRRASVLSTKARFRRHLKDPRAAPLGRSARAWPLVAGRSNHRPSVLVIPALPC